MLLSRPPFFAATTKQKREYGKKTTPFFVALCERTMGPGRQQAGRPTRRSPLLHIENRSRKRAAVERLRTEAAEGVEALGVYTVETPGVKSSCYVSSFYEEACLSVEAAGRRTARVRDTTRGRIEEAHGALNIAACVGGRGQGLKGLVETPGGQRKLRLRVKNAATEVSALHHNGPESSVKARRGAGGGI